MLTSAKFCVYFTKINSNCFFDTLPLVSEAGHSPNIKSLFLRLTDWDGELHQNLQHF